MAYVLRFTQNSRKSLLNQPLLLGELQQDELYQAELLLYRQAQLDAFSEEIMHLKAQKRLRKTSVLYKLAAFIDDDGVLRVDSRIANAPEPRQNPIILPKNSRISALVVQHYHSKFHHLNNETVINELRQYFHIPRLRSTVKLILKNCQTCKLLKGTPAAPQMAKLPLARTTPYVAPFTFTGVDFLGLCLFR